MQLFVYKMSPPISFSKRICKFYCFLPSSSLFASWQLDAISLLDLQFALAHQTASADTEAELRSLITGLQGESDLSKDLVLSLQAELEKSQQKVIELEEQLRWQELENQNQLNIKEAKIQEFKRSLNIYTDSKVCL